MRRSDTNVVILLLCITIAALLLIPYIDDIRSSFHEDNQPAWNGKHSQNKDAAKQQYYYVPEKTSELFHFDPNTADSTQLLRLGLKPWQVRSIYKYRAMGGRYNKPTDFARLYGLTLKQYKRLEPYIRIEREIMAAEVYGNEGSSYSTRHNSSGNAGTDKDSSLAAYPKKLEQGEQIDINTADTNTLKRIPGIGSYYAGRIARFRERFGFIASPRQLLEIEGLPESSLAYMKTESKEGNSGFMVKINRLDVQTLAKHPYIRYIQAKEIMNFRRLRGDIKSADDLRRLPSFTDNDVARLLPYIDFR